MSELHILLRTAVIDAVAIREELETKEKELAEALDKVGDLLLDAELESCSCGNYQVAWVEDEKGECSVEITRRAHIDL